MDTSNSKLTDLSFLRNFSGNNRDKMAKYINMFLQLAPQQIDNIETYLSNKDWDSLRTAAHSLKPQITYMGIKSQEEAIKSIEEYAGNKSNLEQLRGIVDEFKTAMQNAIGELHDELKNM